MSKRAKNPKVDETVQAMAELDLHSHQYTVTLRPEQALMFAKSVEGGNWATVENQTKVVQGLIDLAPKMDLGSGNPNTGQLSCEFIVGCESSRVIYFVQRKWAIDKDFNWQALIAKAEAMAKAGEADEFHVITNDNEELRLRFWWD